MVVNEQAGGPGGVGSFSSYYSRLIANDAKLSTGNSRQDYFNQGPPEQRTSVVHSTKTRDLL